VNRQPSTSGKTRHSHAAVPEAERALGVAHLGRARSFAGTLPAIVERGETMSVTAYILIQTEVGKAPSVVGAVRGLPGVDEAYDVTGPYDVIVKATADTIDDLGKMVASRVQLVDGITRTLTCPVVSL